MPGEHGARLHVGAGERTEWVGFFAAEYDRIGITATYGEGLRAFLIHNEDDRDQVLVPDPLSNGVQSGLLTRARILAQEAYGRHSIDVEDGASAYVSMGVKEIINFASVRMRTGNLTHTVEVACVLQVAPSI
ncbi:hypothetical protein D7Y42_03790 [Stenotrophomonas maltophilia]|nr:hypothetical protein [Stenotrophomonas maltophilia]